MSRIAPETPLKSYTHRIANTIWNHCFLFKATCDWVFTTAAANLTTVLLFILFSPRLFSWQAFSLLSQISSDPHVFIPFSHPQIFLTIQSVLNYIFSSPLFQCLMLYSVVTLALWPCCLFFRFLWNFSSCWLHACCISSYLPFRGVRCEVWQSCPVILCFHVHQLRGVLSIHAWMMQLWIVEIHLTHAER